MFGRRIKSLAFTTDVAIIRNINADAVIAVYPFTPQPAIHRAVMQAADMPVFAGVGGGVTRGPRVLNLANDAEHEGAFGVVVNAPTSNEIIHLLKQVLDIPVVVTVVSEKTDVAARLAAGADILNISGAQHTPAIVRQVREQFPDVPIIATGGPTDDTILETIRAGANAITYTPPPTGICSPSPWPATAGSWTWSPRRSGKPRRTIKTGTSPLFLGRGDVFYSILWIFV